MANHLSGRKGKFLKLSFRNTVDLSAVRKVYNHRTKEFGSGKERGMHNEDLMNFMDDTANGNTGSLNSRRKNPESYGLIILSIYVNTIFHII